MKLDDDAKAMIVCLGKMEESDGIEKIRNDMAGAMFYDQPYLLAEFYKLKTKGQLLGEKERLTLDEALRMLEKVAGRKCNFEL